MKKIPLIFALMLFSIGILRAQNQSISGKITSSEDGEALPGVSISVVGTSIGATTDIDGNFKINVERGKSLKFSFVGFKSKTIKVGNQSTINLELEVDETQLIEVFVTGAYEVKRSKRSDPTNSQLVDQKALNVIRQTDINNALAGKVSGVQIRSQAAAALGRASQIRLRGASGLGSGDGAIYVVNGTVLPDIQSLVLDDIENVSVIQGPAASAQFGSQGANGAIVVTLKEGKKNPEGTIGLQVNTGITSEKAYILPNYQNEYAGGASADLIQYNYKAGDPEEWKTLDGKYYHDYSDDASWGPRMVGQEYIPWYAWYPGTKYTGKTASLVAQPNNARDFYNTAVTKNSSFIISTAGDNFKFKLSYGNQNVKGMLEKTSLVKNSFNLNTSYDLNKYLTASVDFNYSFQDQMGEVDDGYSNQSSGSFSQWFHRDLDMGIMKELRGLKVPGTDIYASWNHANPNAYDPNNPRNFYAGNYWYNFYTWFDLVTQSNRKSTLFGYASLEYKVNKDLKIKGTYRRQEFSTAYERTYSSKLLESGLQTTGNSPEARGFYGYYNDRNIRTNYELSANYLKKVKDFTF